MLKKSSRLYIWSVTITAMRPNGAGYASKVAMLNAQASSSDINKGLHVWLLVIANVC